MTKARIYVWQEFIVCYVFFLLCWGVVANDVCQRSHKCWAKTYSMTCVPCFFVAMFWQMMFARLVLALTLGKETSYHIYLLLFVGVSQQVMFDSARMCWARIYHMTCFHCFLLGCFGK